VPTHLRDASYRGASSLGHGEGYDYPHDDPRGWVPQQYRPPELAGRRYYEPSGLGAEAEVADRLARWREQASTGDDDGNDDNMTDSDEERP
jgi:putative ATPase